MQSNPYQPTSVPLDRAHAARESTGFPFLLVIRWVVGALVFGYGVLSIVNVINSWAWLADRAIIDVASSPYLRLAAQVCVLLTGALLFLRSKLVFFPLLAHVAYVLWLTFGFGPALPVSGVIYLAWAAQSGLLGLCLLLSIQRRLR
jgi:hypothetical protein